MNGQPKHPVVYRFSDHFPADKTAVLPTEEGTRCTDDDRRDALDHLRDAYSRGALNHEEFTVRTEGVLTAVSRKRLRTLTSDLPGKIVAGMPPKPVSRSPRLRYKMQAAAWARTPVITSAVPAVLFWLGTIMGGWNAQQWTMGAGYVCMGIVSVIAWIAFTCLAISGVRSSNARQWEWEKDNLR